MSLGSENRRDVSIICRACHKNHHFGREVFDDYKIANLSEDENISENLFSELKKWRLKKSKELYQPAYRIFHDKTLKELSSKKPSTKEELLKINGIKEFKLNNYGDEVLDIIKREIQINGVGVSKRKDVEEE